MRALPIAAGSACAALLSGCGLGGDQNPGEPAEVDHLRVKLRALTADPCHSDPPSQPPHGCEKYVTQLGGTANAVADVAQRGHPDLAEPGHRLKQGIEAYRDGQCDTEKPPSTLDCYEVLGDIATAVSSAQAALGQG